LCYRCNKEGHYARNCPNQDDQPKAGTGGNTGAAAGKDASKDTVPKN
jgi:hypothetical protein